MPLAVDSRIIEAARSGGDALDRLVEQVWPEAYRIALSILGDRGLSEDCAQEACAAIARSLPSLKRCDVFPGWTYKIIVNTAITASRRRPSTEPLSAACARAAVADTTDALDLAAALSSLPIAQRSAIILHYYAGLNSSEIAAAAGLPPSTVRFHLMLARRALRKALSSSDSIPATASTEVHNHAH